MLLSFGKPAGDFVGFHQPRCHVEIRPSSAAQRLSPDSVSGASGGWEMRNSYKLSAMEPASTSDTWSMRQMAVYHSLDLTNGNSFTMTIKANHREIAGRIRSLPLGGETVPGSVKERFTASLETQLLSFCWCIEGWASYINSMEHKVRQMSVKAVGIPMQSEERTVRRLTNLEETPNNGSSRNSTAKSYGHYLLSIRRWMGSILRADCCGTNPTADDSIPLNRTVGGSNAGEESMLNKMKKAAAQHVEDLRTFPFDGLQTLHSTSMKLREAKLVMELNRQVLQEIQEHYQAAFDSDEIPQEVKTTCRMTHRGFQKRIKYLENLLSMECLRADTLTHMAIDGQGLVSQLSPKA